MKELQLIKDDTVKKEKLISQFQQKVNAMKDDIRMLNMKITETEKTNENLRSSICLLKKHINVLNSKFKMADYVNGKVIMNIANMYQDHP